MTTKNHQETFEEGYLLFDSVFLIDHIEGHGIDGDRYGGGGGMWNDWTYTVYGDAFECKDGDGLHTPFHDE